MSLDGKEQVDKGGEDEMESSPAKRRICPAPASALKSHEDYSDNDSSK